MSFAAPLILFVGHETAGYLAVRESFGSALHVDESGEG
jgi:hypothetical protein